MGGDRTVLYGQGQEEHTGRAEDEVTDFKDHEIESSRRDRARFKAHGWKVDVKEKVRDSSHHRPEPRKVDPEVSSALARTSSRDSASRISLDRRSSQSTITSTAPSHQPALANGNHEMSTSSSFYSAVSEAGRSSSRQDSSILDRPRSESPVSLRHDPIPRTSTPPPIRAQDRTPVLNVPGYLVTNSRAAPLPLSEGGSPPRLIPTASLTKPLHPNPSNGSLRPPSSISGRAASPSTSIGAPPSPRRSYTTGSALGPTSSRASASSRLNQSPMMPHRTLSYSQSSPQGDSSYFSNIAGDSSTAMAQSSAAGAAAPYDEVESSIAAQADVIRKQRQEKRLAEERERGDLSAAAAAGRTSSGKAGHVGSGLGSAGQPNGPGGAPMTKRRSTRAGSGDSQGGGMAQGVLVGNLIGQDHANYVLMYNMLTGIRIGVSRCQAKPKRELTDADYTARHKFSFDIVGNELTPSTKYDFKFKDYAPWVFRELREYFYLDPSDYLVSLTAKYILSELGSPGKSGSFFYFSRDYRFIIKTIRHSEHKFLRSILKEYHQHIKSNPHTLLSRFYGLHRVKLPRGKKIHFVIMNNLFPPHRDIHETYDLKGSAIGREYPEEKARDNPRAILKDLNFVGRDRVFALGPEKKALFEEQLRRDTELMQRLGIMDYSLLTGVHNLVRGNVDNLRDGMLSVFQPDTVKMRRKPTLIKSEADATALRKAVQRSDPKALSDTNKLPDQDTSERRLFLFYQDEGGMRATDGNNEELGVIYYLGIIDILTPYTFVKKVEHFFKGLKHDKHMISAVPPKEYGERFMSFIYSRIIGNDPSKGPRMYEHDPPLPHQQQEHTMSAGTAQPTSTAAGEEKQKVKVE